MMELMVSIREKGVLNLALLHPKPEGSYKWGQDTGKNIPVSLPGKRTTMYCTKSAR